MSTLSIITPVYSGGDEFLIDAYRSLRDQQLPTGWEWEWIVQEDGTTGYPLRRLPRDPRITPGCGRAGRACMARTAALSRASGSLVRTLDADDLLTPGALARDIAVLTEHPELGWTACAALDLHPDGTLTGVDTDPPGGRLALGSLFASYTTRRLAILGTTLCVRRDLVLALGGWPALPSSEDVGLMLALDAVAPGWFITEVGAHYRKHPAQSTQAAAFHDPQEATAKRAIITERVNALRRLGWSTHRPCS